MLPSSTSNHFFLIPEKSVTLLEEELNKHQSIKKDEKLNKKNKLDRN